MHTLEVTENPTDHSQLLVFLLWVLPNFKQKNIRELFQLLLIFLSKHGNSVMLPSPLSKTLFPILFNSYQLPLNFKVHSTSFFLQFHFQAEMTKPSTGTLFSTIKSQLQCEKAVQAHQSWLWYDRIHTTSKPLRCLETTFAPSAQAKFCSGFLLQLSPALPGSTPISCVFTVICFLVINKTGEMGWGLEGTLTNFITKSRFY